MTDTDTSRYAYAADAVITSGGHVLLIDRAWFPLGLALPGGHVDPNEDARTAAARELAEEVHVHIDPADLTAVPGEWDAPDRDPRGRVITAAFGADLPARPAVTADDDAAGACWVPIADVLDGKVAFAFGDHADIIAAAVAVLAGPDRLAERRDQIRDLTRHADQKASLLILAPGSALAALGPVAALTGAAGVLGGLALAVALAVVPAIVAVVWPRRGLVGVEAAGPGALAREVRALDRIAAAKWAWTKAALGLVLAAVALAGATALTAL